MNNDTLRHILRALREIHSLLWDTFDSGDARMRGLVEHIAELQDILDKSDGL